MIFFSHSRSISHLNLIPAGLAQQVHILGVFLSQAFDHATLNNQMIYKKLLLFKEKPRLFCGAVIVPVIFFPQLNYIIFHMRKCIKHVPVFVKIKIKI